MFYVRKFRNTNGSVEANISHQIAENVKPKDPQAENTYSHYRYLARLYEADQRTVFGKTLRRISHECGTTLKPFPSKNLVKKHMKYFAVPNSETWRLSLVHEPLAARNERSTIPGFSI